MAVSWEQWVLKLTSLNQLEEFCCPNQPLNLSGIYGSSMPTILSVGAEVGEVKAGKKVLFSDINAYEVDLGTDGRHCFCKESELLAVVE
ncbi:10 kDa chaperonin [Prunus yedoensis var. nudiflora]|uniref:10 kDa chaperonin n=1 Tax=Prunus yedoensis var. nudiflora TaxID=2094558 RepID=A0A314XUD7_PRUYE|nr:10 kDa chaperonin [Prunus yedoensis var. nudiflora]